MRFVFFVYLIISTQQILLAQDSLQLGLYNQIDWENDVFQIRSRNVTDRYYTNGLSYTQKGNYWGRWPTRHALLKIAQPVGKTYPHLYDFSAGQEIYTPKKYDVARRPLYPNDRPYAGYLYASWGLTTIDPDRARRLTSSLTIGVIGPASGAAEVQEGLHRLLKNNKPLGWGTQIKNDLALSYYVKYEGRPVPRLSPVFDVIGYVEGNIGSLMNFAGTGGRLQFGFFNDYFNNITGLDNAASQRKFQCYAFVQTGFRAVLDNALLQGGWFNNHDNYYALPAVEMKHFYGQVDVGGVIALRTIQVSFTQRLRTAEFVDGLDAQWGRISVLIGGGKR